MSQLRYDPTANEWVIFATARNDRPKDIHPVETTLDLSDPSTCPLCPGNEVQTEPEIYALRRDSAPNGPGWSVRVVPNKYPILHSDDPNEHHQDGPLFRRMEGFGHHEVLIESPDHQRVLAHQSVAHLASILQVMQCRFNSMLDDDRIQAVMIFKNHGSSAGSSLRHPHCQLIGLPVVPKLLRRKLDVAATYFDMTGQNVYFALLSDEFAINQRVLVANNQFVALLPYASHVPYEIWILPRNHLIPFGYIDSPTFDSLAAIIKTVLLKLYIGLHDPDFNMTLITPPRGDEDKRYFHWHIEILPRLHRSAGFELGTGMSINTVLPEDATQQLRHLDIAEAGNAGTVNHP